MEKKNAVKLVDFVKSLAVDDDRPSVKPRSQPAVHLSAAGLRRIR